VRRFACLLMAVAAVPLVLRGAAAPQSVDPAIVFESPTDEGYASGPMPIRIRLEPKADAEVQSVSFVADGKLVCTVERPPFECAWDAGPKVAEHAIRVSVLLKNGQRLTHTIHTKAAGYTETVDVDVVQVTATVTDGRGRFVKGLTRENFKLFEDDAPQAISSFMSENVPLEIIVAVDVSGSMKDAMPTVQQAVKKFLSSLRPTDSVTLVSFNDNVFTLAKPNVDLAARLRAVDRLAPWGGTALYDVVVKSIDQLGRQTGRRALVVFTDGEDLNSRVPLEAAERRLEASDAVLYPIGQGRAPKLDSLKRILEGLAQKTGGRAFFEDLDELEAVFGRIVDELSSQYLIGYPRPDTSKDGRWRKLRVDVPGRDVKIRTRQGYRVVEK
jgi:Ca-activated chloride channel homolog